MGSGEDHPRRALVSSPSCFLVTKNGAASTLKPASAVGALWSSLGKPTVAVLYLLTQVL